jgi:hypothetical protein
VCSVTPDATKPANNETPRLKYIFSPFAERAEKKGKEGIAEYWEKKNQLSIDGKPTGVLGS